MIKYIVKLKPLKSKKNQIDHEQTLANEPKGRVEYSQHLQGCGWVFGVKLLVKSNSQRKIPRRSREEVDSLRSGLFKPNEM